MDSRMDSRMGRRDVGRIAEQVAASWLTERGWRLVTRNFNRRVGELDIVAQQGRVLAVIEVRTRANDEYGGAAASVTARKQRRVLRATEQLLQQRRDLCGLLVRFDVMVVHEPHASQPRVEWIQHAFEAR
ncbi:MAG TPA: YraN family protein [Steroidobacteraceae bacterium]|nr:YraN family protein [Steroidobacteraceae bacterium]